jgi:hypothetical protein
MSDQPNCTYCGNPVGAKYSFSYGFPGVPRVYKCDRAECVAPTPRAAPPPAPDLDAVEALRAERDTLRTQRDAASESHMEADNDLIALHQALHPNFRHDWVTGEATGLGEGMAKEIRALAAERDALRAAVERAADGLELSAEPFDNACTELRRALGRPTLAAPPTPGAGQCWCETCRPNVGLGGHRMIVCPDCGNKRCPRATHHDNACTGSNEPGQPGSSWEHFPTPGAGREGEA